MVVNLTLNDDNWFCFAGPSSDPVYNVLDDPGPNGRDAISAPYHDVLDSHEKSRDHSNPASRTCPRYNKPPKSVISETPRKSAETATTPTYDVLEGPNPDNGERSEAPPCHSPLYDVLEEQDSQSSMKQKSTQAPLYDVLEGSEPIPVSSPNRGGTSPTCGASDQMYKLYEALQSTRESIYQLLV